jgi:uncharacterized protein
MAATVSPMAPPTGSDIRHAGRRGDLVELGVFLFLIVPAMALSFIIPAQQEQLAFPLTAVATILRDLALVALIVFFLWRAGESPRALGWTTRHVGREVAIGVALFVPLFFAARWLEALMIQLGLTAPSSSPAGLVPARSAAELLLALVLVVVVAISEETIFRGYLLLRLRPIVRSGAVALVLASMIFAVGHGYEGTAGAVTVGTLGLAFGAVYLWRRSLVAPATMHLLLDPIPILLIPLLR